jgi:phosphatidate cytidylyltransferase
MPDNARDQQAPSDIPQTGVLSRELQLRILSGVGVAVVALALVYWSAIAFAALTFVIAAAMAWEWNRMVRGQGSDTVAILHIVTILAAVLLTASGMAGLAIAAVAVGAISVSALMFGSGIVPLSGAGVFYTGLPVIALNWLRGDEPLGFTAALFVLLCVAVTDTAAYAAGRTIGGAKLWPAISPNKTWAGLLGGIAAAALTGALYALFSGSGSALWLASLGLILGLVAQGGDLAESALKRHYGLKDTSGLLPGHGGVMDRMDGIVMASIAAALVAFAIDAYAPARALLYGS